MPTLRTFRRAALRRASAIGRVYDISALAATTITVNELIGAEGDKGFFNWWALRSDAASAGDRRRRITDSVGSTGVLTIVGNYSDTTATGESVELFKSEMLIPYFDESLNQVFHRLRFTDEEIIATHGAGAYNLAELALGTEPGWIVSPRFITKVYHSPSPVLSRNRYFDKWNSVDSAGALVPDFWTLAGTGATFAREATIKERKAYSLSVATTGGNVGTVSQTVWPWNGVGADSLRGRTINIVGVVRSGAASSVRLRCVETLNDGTTVTTNSSYHAGNAAFAELSVAVTVNAATRSITFSVRVETNETAYIDELYLMDGTVDDAVRRDEYDRQQLYPTFRQVGSFVEMLLPTQYSVGTQLIVQSYHPYLSPTVRLTGDGWNCDAPQEIVAEWTLHEVYKQLAASASGESRAEYMGKVAEHARNANAMAMGHIYMEDGAPTLGMPPSRTMWRLGPGARRRV